MFLNGDNILLDGDSYLVDISDTALNIINTIQNTDVVILTEAEVLYVWYIVDRLIEEGIWTKIKALYGFVGGTAATHKWNWKDMRDLDAAFRITWGSHATHSSDGFMNNNNILTDHSLTHFNETHLTSHLYASLGVYCKYNVGDNLTNSGMLGNIEAIATMLRSYHIRSGAGGTTRIGGNNLNNNILPHPYGFTAGNRNPDNNLTQMVREDTITQSSLTPFGGASGFDWAIGSLNPGTSYDRRMINFAYISDGLTTSQLIKIRHIATTAQKILNRA